MNHIQNRPGEKFTVTELTMHFNCGSKPLIEILRNLVDVGRLESTAGTTYSRNIYKPALYYLKEQPESTYKPMKPRTLTLAERIMRERCQELYPANRDHHEYEHSAIKENNLDRD